MQRTWRGLFAAPPHYPARSRGSINSFALDATRAPVDISVAWQRSNSGKGLKWFVERLKQMRFDPEYGELTQNI